MRTCGHLAHLYPIRARADRLDQWMVPSGFSGTTYLTPKGPNTSENLLNKPRPNGLGTIEFTSS